MPPSGVAIGPTDVAGTATAYAEGLRTHGVDADVVLSFRSPWGYGGGRVLGPRARALYALRGAFRRDVFHYQFGLTLLPRALDARWARTLRRTVVVSFYGDDCRRHDAASRLGWPMVHLKEPALDAAVAARLRSLGSIAHAAVACDLEIASYLVGFFDRIYVAPLPVLDRPSPARGAAGPKLVALHAPSDRLVKGTAIVERAAARAAESVPLELRVVTGVGNDEVRAALGDADLVIDQAFSVSASMLALEAMQAGLPVLSHVDERGLAPFQRDVPMVSFEQETLAAELEALARDDDRRRRLGERGRAYVERVHAAARASGAIVRVYDHARTAPPGVYEATPDAVEPLPAELVATLRAR